MHRISGNDILEIIEIDGSFTPQRAHNDLMAPDQRAKWTMQIIQAWGMMATFGDIINSDKNPAPQPVPPSELVMRVCEVVDAAWNEMQHRGWIVTSKSMTE